MMSRTVGGRVDVTARKSSTSSPMTTPGRSRRGGPKLTSRMPLTRQLGQAGQKLCLVDEFNRAQIGALAPGRVDEHDGGDPADIELTPQRAHLGRSVLGEVRLERDDVFGGVDHFRLIEGLVLE